MTKKKQIINNTKIISLYGKASCGKTETLSLLIEQFLKKRAKPINGIADCYSKVTGKKRKERTIAFEYKKKKWIITTLGDSKKIIQKELDKVYAKYSISLYDVDYFICASNNQRTKNYLNGLAKNIIYIPKIYCSFSSVLDSNNNAVFASYLFDIVNQNIC